MIFGQTIRAVSGGTSTYYGPWFSRKGTRAVFACDTIAIHELDTFEIIVQTKKQEDTNEVKEAWTGADVSSVGVNTFERGTTIAGPASTQGFHELVRFVYTVTSNASKNGWCQFRMLDPTWEND